MVYDKQKKWLQYLNLAEWWYNTSYHSAIKTTPFEALYGYSPPQLALGSALKSAVEAVNSVLQDRHEALQQLKENLNKAQEKMKYYADKKRIDRQFDKGSWVYLKLQPYRQQSVAGKGNQKLNPKYHGPFEVLKKIGEAAYHLNLPPGSSIHPVFHVSQLKGHIGKSQLVSSTVPLMGNREEVKSEPQNILARRMIKKGNAAVTQILIQWSNQEVEDASWENYYSIAERYPQFILEVEKGLKEKGVSRLGKMAASESAQLEMAMDNFDWIKTTVEGERFEGAKKGKSSRPGENQESLRVGPKYEPLTKSIKEKYDCQIGTKVAGLEIKGVTPNGDKKSDSG